MIGIYKIENIVNGRVYIGQSVDIEKRWRSHTKELRKGTHANVLLQDDWLIYGEEHFTFEVIKKCRSIKLNEFEKYYIKHYNAFDNGYNQTVGNGRTLIDKREIDNSKCIVILANDKVNDLCAGCDYTCKQSSKNEIIMCKWLAQNR